MACACRPQHNLAAALLIPVLAKIDIMYARSASVVARNAVLVGVIAVLHLSFKYCIESRPWKMRCIERCGGQRTNAMAQARLACAELVLV